MTRPSALFARGTTDRVSSGDRRVILIDVGDDHPFLRLVRKTCQVAGISRDEAVDSVLEHALDNLGAPR